MKNWNILLSLIGLFLIILILIGIKFKSDNKEIKEQKYCGTTSKTYNHSYQNGPDSISIVIGKKLFKEQCAMCHNKTMKDDLTGPALKGAIRRFNNDTIQFAKYLINQENYLSSENDHRILLLHERFEKIQKPKYRELSMNDIKSIIEYIEKIYY